MPRKNLAPLGGVPLIVHTIRAAVAVRHHFTDLIVSTEDEEIARVAQAEGADVPFLRPADLASDQAPTREVVLHAVDFVETRDQATLDWVLILQPTAPLRSSEDILGALDVAGRDTGCDSVISVVRAIDTHPVFMKRIVGGRLEPFCVPEQEGTRRQEVEPPAYIRNGAIYLTRRDVIVDKGSVWGESICPYLMPAERSVNVDSQLDLDLAEILLTRRGA